jgi:selenocysteine lyase/cysteine desulfurase
VSNAPPKVFISYSHDSPEHEDRVLGLANRLREDGIDAEIDQYEISPPQGWPSWYEQQIKSADFVHELNTSPDFGPFDGRVWLNCAHQAPLPDVARAEAEEAVAWKAAPWELTTERFSGVPRRLKQALGRLIAAPPDDIILANSASYGLHLIANGFPWKAGDEVLVMRGDFPSDILPWLGLARRGVTVRQLSPHGRVLESDEVEAAVGPNTRLLCLTWVHSLSGWAIDLEAIGSLCRARGVTFVVNASQAVGVRPIDVRRAPVDALISVGWKWLLGPYATGFCWVGPELRAALDYNQSYWLAMLSSDDLGREDIDLTPRRDPGAARYDVFATANFFNFKPLSASVEYLLEYDIEAVRRHDEALVQRLIDGLDRRKYRLTSPEAGPQRSTLVFVESAERGRAEDIYRALQAERVHVAFRAGALRLSPHLYNTPGDIDRALEALHRA